MTRNLLASCTIVGAMCFLAQCDGTSPLKHQDCAPGNVVTRAEIDGGGVLCMHQHLSVVLSPGTNAPNIPPGVLEIPFQISEQEQRKYCFEDDDGEIHKMTISFSGQNELSLKAGDECVQASLPKGMHMLQLTHAAPGSVDPGRDLVHSMLEDGAFKIKVNACQACGLTDPDDLWPLLRRRDLNATPPIEFEQYGLEGDYSGATIGGRCLHELRNEAPPPQCVLSGIFSGTKVHSEILDDDALFKGTYEDADFSGISIPGGWSTFGPDRTTTITLDGSFLRAKGVPGNSYYYGRGYTLRLPGTEVSGYPNIISDFLSKFRIFAIEGRATLRSDTQAAPLLNAEIDFRALQLDDRDFQTKDGQVDLSKFQCTHCTLKNGPMYIGGASVKRIIGLPLPIQLSGGEYQLITKDWYGLRANDCSISFFDVERHRLQLDGGIFSNVEFSSAEPDTLFLDGSNWANLQLADSSLNSMRLPNSDWSGSVLSNVRWNRVDASGQETSFADATLKAVKWNDSLCDHCDFSHADVGLSLTRSSVQRAFIGFSSIGLGINQSTIDGTQFVGGSNSARGVLSVDSSSLKGVRFDAINMAIDMTDTVASDSQWNGATMENSSFNACDLTNSKWNGTKMAGTVMNRTSLQNSSWSRVDGNSMQMVEVILKDAALDRVNWSESTLTNAVACGMKNTGGTAIEFSSANLTSTVFATSTLYTSCTATDVATFHTDSSTICPDGHLGACTEPQFQSPKGLPIECCIPVAGTTCPTRKKARGTSCSYDCECATQSCVQKSGARVCG